MADDTKTYTEEEVSAKIADIEKGLKANRDEALKEAKAAKAKLAALEGIDPDDYRRLKQAAEEAERRKAAEEGNFKALETQLLEKHRKEVEKRESEMARIRSALDSTLMDREALAELAKHSDAPSLLLPHVVRQMKVVEEDGHFVARIVDDKGNVRIGKGQGSAPMTLPELIEDMKGSAEYGLAFRGSRSSGGGAAKSTTPGGGGGSRFIAANDAKSILDNLAGLSKGEVQVQ